MNPTQHYSERSLHAISLLRNLAKRKFDQDFAHSNLHSPRAIGADWLKTAQILKVAGILRPKRVSVAEPKSMIRTLCYSGIAPSDALARVRKHGPIHLSTESIAAAPIVVARSLASRDAVKIGLTVSFEDVNGRDHMYSLDRSTIPPDCFIAPDGAFHFNASATLDSYRLILPCFYEDQYFLRRHGATRRAGGKLFCFPNSSAETMLRFIVQSQARVISSEIDAGLFSTLKTVSDLAAHTIVQMIEARDLPQQARNLDDADLIIAWEPLATWLIKYGGGGNLEIVPNSWFPVVFSLNAHTRWTHPEQSGLLADFVELFVAEWEFCKQNLEYAWGLIENDVSFLIAFGIGAGVDVPPLMGPVTSSQDASSPKSIFGQHGISSQGDPRKSKAPIPSGEDQKRPDWEKRQVTLSFLMLEFPELKALEKDEQKKIVNAVQHRLRTVVQHRPSLESSDRGKPKLKWYPAWIIRELAEKVIEKRKK